MTIAELYNIAKAIPTTFYEQTEHGIEYHEWDTKEPSEEDSFIDRSLVDVMDEATGDFCDLMFSSSIPIRLVELLKQKLSLYVEWWENCKDKLQWEQGFKLSEFYVVCKNWLSIIEDFIKEPQQREERESNKPAKNVCQIDTPADIDREELLQGKEMYFDRAIKAGFMEKTDNGYRWLFGGKRGQARLGYFCLRVYNQPRPINDLEKLFGVSKLSASITNAEFEPKRADVKKWRKEMDVKVFF